jgi:glutathione S-transferase
MAIGVMKARKRCGVEFPDLYAKESNPKKSEFDAVQRGHQNVLENIPIFLAVQACVAVAAGPVVAAGFIAVWTVAKV